MKKLSFFLVLFYLTLTSLSAQDIALTFNAKDASNTIDSIRATKVLTGETAFVEGSNTINLSSFFTGTKLISTNFGEVSIYPNPFENFTQLKFYLNQNDNVKISLVNSAGQIVAEETQDITQGLHRFNISVNVEGLYIINVKVNQSQFSQKIISTKDNQSFNKIEYNGYSSVSQKVKSAKIEDSELIHFFLYSGDNITKIADSLTESKTYEVEFYECKDSDGKSYPIVQIGDQWWMAENLAYLPSVSPSSQGSLTEPYYYVYGYDGSDVATAKQQANYAAYGVLFNWPAVKAACPPGWHLPTYDEWAQLAQFVSDQKGPYFKSDNKWYEVGKHLKATSGWNNDSGNTDDFGFSGLLGGNRFSTGGFYDIAKVGYWWSATEYSAMYPWECYLSSYNVNFGMGYGGAWSGESVRCVRD